MHVVLSEQYIDEYITFSAGEIDKHVEGYLKEGSGKILIRLEIILIKAYTYRRATGGSYIPTPKKLANTKCTINPKTYALSEKCLQGALGCYFADQDRITDHLSRRIFRAESLRKYLDIVKLDGIPMPTPIYSRIFKYFLRLSTLNMRLSRWSIIPS